MHAGPVSETESSLSFDFAKLQIYILWNLCVFCSEKYFLNFFLCLGQTWHVQHLCPKPNSLSCTFLFLHDTTALL